MPFFFFLGRKGPSGFSASSTAEEVTQGIDGTGLTAIVTGASSGIGSETARILASRGVHVVMGVRNLAMARDVKDAIVKEIPNAKVDILELDLSSMASIKKFVSEFNSLGLPLNILINNAGILALDFLLSQDNIELHFATNHIGHFLFTDLLLETMETTARQSNLEGRIVNVSSTGHNLTYHEGIHFDKINDKSRFFFKTLQQGAATTCCVALHPQLKGVSGQYFSNSNIANTSSQAQDIELANKLWDFS